MNSPILAHIDALIAELESLKTNVSLLESKEENIKAHIAQIRAMIDTNPTSPQRKKAGWAKGFVKHIAEDFDGPIDDMADYS